jgi:hypothetical protein
MMGMLQRVQGAQGGCKPSHCVLLQYALRMIQLTLGGGVCAGQSCSTVEEATMPELF